MINSSLETEIEVKTSSRRPIGAAAYQRRQENRVFKSAYDLKLPIPAPALQSVYCQGCVCFSRLIVVSIHPHLAHPPRVRVVSVMIVHPSQNYAVTQLRHQQQMANKGDYQHNAQRIGYKKHLPW